MNQSVCERDSSGTTVAGKAREGDGADSPTQAAQRAAQRLAQMPIKKKL
jgi:hypothetical protein